MYRFSIKSLFFVTTFVAAAEAVLTGGEAAVVPGLAIIAMLLVALIVFALQPYGAREKRVREADEQNPTT